MHYDTITYLLLYPIQEILFVKFLPVTYEHLIQCIHRNCGAAQGMQLDICMWVAGWVKLHHIRIIVKVSQQTLLMSNCHMYVRISEMQRCSTKLSREPHESHTFIYKRVWF